MNLFCPFHLVFEIQTHHSHFIFFENTVSACCFCFLLSMYLFFVCLLCIFNYRHTLAYSVWSSTPTRTCPSIQRTSLRCTEGRRGMRCLHTSMPSQSQRTAACFKVWQTVAFLILYCFYKAPNYLC